MLLFPANGSVRSVHLLGLFMFDSAAISTSVFLVGSSVRSLVPLTSNRGCYSLT